MTSLLSLNGVTRAISFVVHIFGRLFILRFKTVSSFGITTVGRNCVLFKTFIEYNRNGTEFIANIMYVTGNSVIVGDLKLKVFFLMFKSVR